ncbi:MAG TPA: TylF/MycF/NovP-related O-methyltransferase [Longimicrobium sp.]|uniref:TylF/MycF/NovP-related O-methyltransferase n=1 Tax=Longimicrobium sp. TaxID=2029185 RepID=UPI002ED927AD
MTPASAGWVARVAGRAKRALLAWRAPAVARAVRAEGLTYLDLAALTELHGAVAGRAHVPGDLVEVGCALGGSALVMALARASNRPLYVYDVFGMPPPPSEGDGPDVHARYAAIAGGLSEGIGGGVYYGYVNGLLERVRETFRRYGVDPERTGVAFVPGMAQDTLPEHGPVAVAHVDCDRYESVRVCLERIAPRLSPGGVMIIDDYDSKSGCRKAVDEYFAARPGEFRLERRSRLHVLRN